MNNDDLIRFGGGAQTELGPPPYQLVALRETLDGLEPTSVNRILLFTLPSHRNDSFPRHIKGLTPIFRFRIDGVVTFMGGGN